MEEKSVLEHVGPIVATEEPAGVSHEAFADLERRIQEIEAAISDLRSMKAQAEPVAAGRKTVGVNRATILAKGGPEQSESATVDEALRSLSIEQRIAVKSGLVRAGLLR